MLFHIEYEIASLLFLMVLILYLKTQFYIKSEINKLFLQMTIVIFVTNIFDVATALMINHAESVPNVVNLLANSLYCLFDVIMGYAICRYFSYATFKKDKFSFLAKYGRVFIGIHAAFLVVNLFTGILFYFSDDHVYTHGPLYILVYIIPYILILGGIVVVAKHYRRYTPIQRVSIILYTVIGYSGSVLQLTIFPDYLLTIFTTATALMIIMFSMETPDFFRLAKTMKKLEATAKKLEKANAAKSEFLSNMSHELRTPINSILGYNELILRDSVDDQVADYALNVQASARALLAQVNNVFDYSDIERDKMEIFPSKYSTASLLQDVALYGKFNAERKSIMFKMEVDENMPSKMIGDMVRVLQILSNLLSNAFKYTKRGFVALKVDWIALGTTRGKMLVTVQDTGVGILPSTLATLGTDAQSSGLGLLLVSKLIALMGGSMKIDSQLEKGTRVYFELEQEVFENDPIGKIPFEGRDAILNRWNEDAFKAPNAKFLVADDNEMNLKLFCGLLRETQIKFDTVYNGDEAILALEQNKYDMVFLDHMMPGKDGIMVLKEMRERKLNEGTPVVALTANMVSGAREKYLAEGFDGYIAKPVNLSEIRACIRELLNKDLIENVNRRSSHGNSMEWLPEQIDGKLGLSYCSGDKSFYLDVLESFVERQVVETIDDAFRAKDFEQYQSLVRSLKSSSLSIGAVQLSSLAKALESAVKSGDYAFVEKNHARMLMEYKLLLRNLRKVMPKREAPVVLPPRPLIMVIDDEVVNLRIAEKLLIDDFEVKSVSTVESAFQFLDAKIPDLILLDVNMPGVSGFDMFGKLQSDDRLNNIPVVFLTGDENVQTEVKCFNAGAMDFIRKPLVKDVVIQRVSRILQLSALQKNLRKEVETRTRELLKEQKNRELLSTQVMSALAGTIDAKDKYTNGHSSRVAKYAQMLGKALGKSKLEQEKIYSIGLLHDIGKIGVPDEIINKPSRLTDDEFELIKKHPGVGSDILKTISTFPELEAGARWHHERYDGRGYPDHLKGEAIPEIARIICVADAYDAMASTRSYRGVLPQEVIREEIEKCKGSQFDPVVADKMLEIIDADTDYLLHE